MPAAALAEDTAGFGAPGGGRARPANPALDRLRAEREAKEDPFNQAAASRELRRSARARERTERAIYESGREEERRAQAPPATSAPAGPPGDSDTAQDGPSAPQSPGVGSSPRRSLLGRAGRGVADNGAGFVLGMIGYALLINGIRGGPSGAWAWVRAKFINDVSHTPAQSAANQAAIANQVRPSSNIPPASSLPSPGGFGIGNYYPTGPLGTIVGGPK